MIKLLLEPVNLLILDEPTNHLDMASKDVLKEAVKAFDGTAIVVSHDREFLDGLVTKVYEFGGGKVREHLGGIYDFLRSRQVTELNQLGEVTSNKANEANKPHESKQDYSQHKEQQRRLRKAERAVEESERKINDMEQRLKELDQLLMDPEKASDMVLVTEYTTTKRALDEEVERWEKLSEELEELTN
jgi:ATP-binding cassette subfamily F protein 3